MSSDLNSPLLSNNGNVEKDDKAGELPPKSRIMRSGTLNQSDFVMASWVMEHALEGKFVDKYPSGQEGNMLRELENELHRLQDLSHIALSVLVAMMLFESPLWCQNSTEPWTFLSNAERCPLPRGANLQTFGVFMLPPLTAICIEVFFLAVLTNTLLHENRVVQKQKDLGHEELCEDVRMPVFFISVVYLMWADVAVYTIVRQTAFRFAPYGRIILMFYYGRVRSVFRAAWNCMDEFLSVLVYIIGTVVFFAWLTVMILDDIVDHDNIFGKGDQSIESLGGKYFGGFLVSMHSFFEIETGANFPDNCIQLISNMHWTVFLFYPFMLLTFFLFTQLMLAIIYNEYSNRMQEDLTTFYTNQIKGVVKVFTALSEASATDPEKKVITLRHFTRLCQCLGSFPRFAKRVNIETCRILFTALDDDSSEELTLQEFFDACELFQIYFYITPKRSIVARKGWFESDRLHNFIGRGNLEACLNIVLILNCLILVHNSYSDLRQVPEGFWVKPALLVFATLYVLHVFVQLLDTSFANFWCKHTNKFDLMTSWPLFLCAVGSLGDTWWAWSFILPYANIMRCMRMLKLLMYTSHFKIMTQCIVMLISISGDMLILLLITTFAFAVFGLQTWGGTLYEANPLLKDSDYLSEDYLVFNFNDMSGSTMTLLNMLIVGYMPEYADALGRVSAWYPSGMLFCTVFFMLGVNVAFNIFTAFTIDVFVTLQEQLEKGEQSEEDKNLQAMKDILAAQGKELSWVIPPEVAKGRVQMQMMDDLETVIKEAQEAAEKELENGKESSEDGPKE